MTANKFTTPFAKILLLGVGLLWFSPATAQKDDISDKERKRIEKAEQKAQKEAEKKKQKQADSANENTDELNILKADTARLNQEIATLQDELQKTKDLLANANKELEDLRPFRELQLKATLKNVDDWAKLPFSQLNESNLKKTLSDCKKYGTGDKEFTEAAKKLESLIADYNSYKGANEALCRPYKKESVKAICDQLKTLMEKYDGKPQQNELAATRELLVDYDGYVMMFRDLINVVNDDAAIASMRTAKNANSTSALLRDFFSDAAQQETMKYIENIPYLKKRLADYKSDLQKNPLENSAVEAEIINMLN